VNENVLCVKVGEDQEWGNGVEDTGCRAVLGVSKIVGKVQSTIFYGNTLNLLWMETAVMNPVLAFQFFCNQFIGKSKQWSQWAAPPPNPIALSRQIYLIPTPEPEPPVSKGRMTVMASGYDPLRGYWVEFEGNFWLHIPIFGGFSNIERVF
jgi:hypothetical protein